MEGRFHNLGRDDIIQDFFCHHSRKWHGQSTNATMNGFLMLKPSRIIQDQFHNVGKWVASWLIWGFFLHAATVADIMIADSSRSAYADYQSWHKPRRAESSRVAATLG